MTFVFVAPGGINGGPYASVHVEGRGRVIVIAPVAGLGNAGLGTANLSALR
jgi:hypothetical protein